MEMLNDDIFEQEGVVHDLMKYAEMIGRVGENDDVDDDDDGLDDRIHILADIRDVLFKVQGVINESCYSSQACKQASSHYLKTRRSNPLDQCCIKFKESLDTSKWKSCLSKMKKLYKKQHEEYVEALKKEIPPSTKYLDEFDKKFPCIGVEKENGDGLMVKVVAERRVEHLDPWSKKPLQTPARFKNCGHYCDYNSAVTMLKLNSGSGRKSASVFCPIPGCNTMVQFRDVVKV